MIVTRKDAHKTFGLDKRLHEGRVGTAVITVIVAVADVTLMSNELFIESRCCFRVTTAILVSSSRVDWDVYKSQTGNHTILLLADGIPSEAEP